MIVHMYNGRGGDAGVNLGFHLPLGYNIGFTSGHIMTRAKQSNLVIRIAFALENRAYA